MHLKNERGQAMVEFALVLPVLILLLCGIIDFGWIFSQKIAANNACREAARYTAIHVFDSSVNNDQTDAAAIVTQSAPYLASPTVTLTYPDSDSISISVSASVPVLTGVTSTVLGSSHVTIHAESTMKIEK